MAELKDLRLSNDRHFDSLKGDISSLRSDIGNLRQDLDTVKRKVEENTLEIDRMYDECVGDVRSLSYRLERV